MGQCFCAYQMCPRVEKYYSLNQVVLIKLNRWICRTKRLIFSCPYRKKRFRIVKFIIQIFYSKFMKKRVNRRVCLGILQDAGWVMVLAEGSS
jgi:hypothetical protein